ncbi:MAG TPA: MopE-related protein, partial [Polyangiales bacterium]|nr:MopE-related protein [Polyangiales bacterium]
DDGKMSAGICGCGFADSSDQDGDGTPDCDDRCPNAPDRASNGSCGCAAAREDGDGDGVLNCRDLCPRDGAKQQPLVCGCGIADGDSDGDGMPDCADECPDDATKVVSGKCGCGVPENSRDHDNDGKLDCVDLCNGLDDARYVPITNCGVGFCSTNATPSSCANAVETECVPGPAKSASDATCDSVDDDCDGAADDDYASSATSCGNGSCVAQGTLACVAGKPVDSCKPRNPAVNDMTCDGLDDDCDGVLDEDFQPRASTCGFGVCAANGTVTCVAGVERDSCTPGAAAGVDTNCNGIDENCDGMVDEGYVGAPTSCGTGACAGTGEFRCIEGSAQDSCRVGTMQPNDPTCDGVDDDCDGTKDENYAPVPSACGVGACRRSGQINCVSGRPSDTCRAGAPASDNNCNGIDDDCNTQVDEDYVVPTSTCGLGVCQRSGVINCVAGQLQNTCVAGAPNSANDGPPANGLDDDCDGQVDEDACVDRTPRTYSVGSYANIAVPAGCLTASVRLWGGGGGAGDQTSVGATGTPGRGGSGGYVEGAVAISGALNLYVGNGGAGCGSGGTNPGASTYNGGAGGPGGIGGSARAGSNGQDGVVAGGGAGATAGSGNGGRGYYGGGGGGTGSAAPWPPYPGGGGGGGASSVLLVGSTRALVAGGGGGGGGVNGSSIASRGGAGGEGCSGAGSAQDGGGGGGGGVCVGGTFTRGTNGVPANSGAIPGGRAMGGTGVCGGGGGGYATITFSR